MQYKQHELVSDICFGSHEPAAWEIIFCETFTDSFITNPSYSTDTV